jgi:MFS family permease
MKHALRHWQPAIASALILGFIVGIPYYSLPFFYDYFERGNGWTRAAILLGLPLGTLVTLVAAPLWLNRIPPRTGILWGSAVCALGIAGMGLCGASQTLYFACWIIYMAGWTFAGPLAHQILLARLFSADRGRALALAFFGISLFGAGSVAFVARPLTAAFGYRAALLLIGALLLLALPIAFAGLPPVHPPGASRHSSSWRALAKQRAFWLLLLGSSLTAAGIAGVSQHLKLILRERLREPSPSRRSLRLDSPAHAHLQRPRPLRPRLAG